MLADDYAALGVEREPVRRERPESLRIAFEDRIDEWAGACLFRPLVDGVGPDVGEQKA